MEHMELVMELCPQPEPQAKGGITTLEKLLCGTST